MQEKIRRAATVAWPWDGGRQIEIVDLQETGVGEIFTIQALSYAEYDVPFALVVVEFDNGVRVTGWAADVHKPDDLPIGTKVRFTPSYKPGAQFQGAKSDGKENFSSGTDCADL